MAWKAFDQNGALLTLSTTTGAVVSVSGTANETVASPSMGDVVVGLADNPIIPGIEGITLPVGMTAERPVAPNEGQVRLNSDTPSFEGYYGATWNTLASLTDLPSAATATEVVTGTVSDKFVAPDTLRNWSTASMGDTGALAYGGMVAASTTTVNIGALTGWVVDNETNPALPVRTYVNYPGALAVTVPTIGSGQISYLLMLPDGLGGATLVWQNSFPTSAQRKTHIYASKASHPNLATLGVVGNETDYITSPIGLTRDFFQAVNYVNNGIHATAVSPGLTFATSAGKIVGNGINFYLDRTNPNEISRGAINPTPFFYRTQIGGATGAVTAIDPTMYDLAGTITAIPGSTNQATIQYIYAIPFNGAIGFVVQYGQTIYSTLALAVTNVGKENPVVFPNLVRDAILAGFLCVQKGCTDLTITTTALFFKADLFGQAAGGSGGTSVSTLQQAYNNSGVVDPQILTSTANDGVKIRRGSAADTDNVLVIQNGAGSATFSVTGAGAITAVQETVPLIIGGTAVGSSLDIRATSGVGAGAEYIKFTGGNNGATEWGRFQAGNLLIGATTSSGATNYPLEIERNTNSFVAARIKNASGGTTANTQVRVLNDVGNVGAFFLYSSGYTTSGAYDTQNSFVMAGVGNDLSLTSITTNKNIRFWMNNATEVMNLYNTGLFIGGSTNATGWLHIGAGTTAKAQIRLAAGVAPSAPNDGDIYYVDTNDRLMFRKNATDAEVISASAVTTEVVVSDTTLTITYNGVTYKLLARA